MGRKKNKSSRKKCSKGTAHFSTKNNETLECSQGSSKNSTDGEGENKGVTVLHETDTCHGCELLFEKYLGKSERVPGREYFVHSLCQMCKRDLRERIPCPKCSLVNYCSEDHRRLHWSEHAELCAVVQAVCRTRGHSHILQSGLHMQPEAFRVLRYTNMLECEAKLQRPLDLWEKEIFIFPNVCGTCHQYQIKSLIVCNSCGHSGFCEGHQAENHDEWCINLQSYKSLLKDQKKFGIICPTIPVCKMYQFLPKLTTIDTAFKHIRRKINDLEFLELTEVVTYPLTALHTLIVLNTVVLSSEKLVLHVVGAEREFETNKLEKWEYYILHLLPKLKNLVVEFIGPELNIVSKPNTLRACHKCHAAEKSITFGFQNHLYHNLTNTPGFTKPDLICVFNPGLYRTTGFNGQDSWSPSIVSMFSQNCPVLTTSYTRKEVHLDVDRVKSVQSIEMLREPTVNPFASLKPSLNFVSDEDSPVIFKNHFYTVMCKA